MNTIDEEPVEPMPPLDRVFSLDGVRVLKITGAVSTLDRWGLAGKMPDPSKDTNPFPVYGGEQLIGFGSLLRDPDSICGVMYAEAIISYATPERLGAEIDACYFLPIFDAREGYFRGLMISPNTPSDGTKPVRVVE